MILWGGRGRVFVSNTENASQQLLFPPVAFMKSKAHRYARWTCQMFNLNQNTPKTWHHLPASLVNKIQGAQWAMNIKIWRGVPTLFVLIEQFGEVRDDRSEGECAVSCSQSHQATLAMSFKCPLPVPGHWMLGWVALAHAHSTNCRPVVQGSKHHRIFNDPITPKAIEMLREFAPAILLYELLIRNITQRRY